MVASVLTALNLLLVATELALVPDAGSAPAPLLALALAAAVVVAVAIAVIVFRLSAGPPPIRATRPIDPSAALAQSDPDAAGHPRPRAPGRAAPAA